jgi:hypothetical protein
VPVIHDAKQRPHGQMIESYELEILELHLLQHIANMTLPERCVFATQLTSPLGIF